MLPGAEPPHLTVEAMRTLVQRGYDGATVAPHVVAEVIAFVLGRPRLHEPQRAR